VRRLGTAADRSYEAYRSYVESRPAEVVANIAICLIHQANYLLDRLMRQLEQEFLKDGGIRERMTKAQVRARQQGKGQRP
jgi:four helix bundle suffix protein